MATNISEVYDSFLSQISDYSYLSDTITQQDIEDDLFGYFKKAKAKFYRCKNSLELVDDGLGGQEFTVDLHPLEIEVLSTLMIVEYLKPKLITDETIKQSLSDKDFKIYSQASQIRELRLLYQSMKADASKMITEYTFLKLEEFDQNVKSKDTRNSNIDKASYTGNTAGGGYNDYEQ
jgi:hypothetical protein